MSDPHAGAWNHLQKWRAALDTTGSEKADGAVLADRGDRALLRRCHTLDEVLLTPVFYQVREAVRQRAPALLERRDADERLAAVLGVLAWVEVDDVERPFARQLGRRRGDSDDALLSGLRFRKLIEARDRDELFNLLRSAIQLLNRTANVRSLARDLFWWSPDTGNTSRRAWAEGYYSAAPKEI